MPNTAENTDRPLKVAFVKQDTEYCIWVSPPQSTIQDTLFSSLQKVGALGTFEAFDTDFFIVKEDSSIECQFWKHVKTKLFDTEHIKIARQLKTTPSKNFLKNCFSETDFCYNDISVDVSSIPWENYDIVISFNIAIPYSITTRNPHVLWCYLINDPVHKAFNFFRFGYDCYLNQECDGNIATKPGIIDFPFSFLGPQTLETLLRDYLGRESLSKGIFAEINSVFDRPVTHVPQLEPLQDLHPIRLHKQPIRENLIEVYDSKYFVKLGGRDIRGNSVLEAISCGTLVLIDPDYLFSHKTLIPPETQIKTIDDIREKISYFDANPEAYQAALSAQRDRVKRYAYDAPISSLINAYRYKTRHKNQRSVSSTVSILKKRLKLTLFIVLHYTLLIRRAVLHVSSLTKYKRFKN